MPCRHHPDGLHQCTFCLLSWAFSFSLSPIATYSSESFVMIEAVPDGSRICSPSLTRFPSNHQCHSRRTTRILSTSLSPSTCLTSSTADALFSSLDWKQTRCLLQPKKMEGFGWAFFGWFLVGRASFNKGPSIYTGKRGFVAHRIPGPVTRSLCMDCYESTRLFSCGFNASWSTIPVPAPL